MASAEKIAERLTPAARALLCGDEGWPDRYSECERVEKQLREPNKLIQGGYSWIGPLSEIHLTAMGKAVRACLQKDPAEKGSPQ